MLPFMDAIAKYLSSELPFFQITWARYFFTVFIVLPLMFFFLKINLNGQKILSYNFIGG